MCVYVGVASRIFVCDCVRATMGMCVHARAGLRMQVCLFVYVSMCVLVCGCLSLLVVI